MIFWLKNRRKADWRDRAEVVTGSPSEFAQMSDEELERFIVQETAALIKASGCEVVPTTPQIAPKARTRSLN